MEIDSIPCIALRFDRFIKSMEHDNNKILEKAYFIFDDRHRSSTSASKSRHERAATPPPTPPTPPRAASSTASTKRKRSASKSPPPAASTKKTGPNFNNPNKRNKNLRSRTYYHKLTEANVFICGNLKEGMNWSDGNNGNKFDACIEAKCKSHGWQAKIYQMPFNNSGHRFNE